MIVDPVPKIQLTVLGCGILGSAIVDGLISESELAKAYRICVTGRRKEHADELREKYRNAYVSISNRDPNIWTPSGAVDFHLAIIATQPTYTREVCLDIKEAVKTSGIRNGPVVLTVCPGITVGQLQKWLPVETPIVRSMPNTPVAVSQGSIALFPNDFIGPKLMNEVRVLLSLTSPCIEILEQESLLDVVASIAGSAPAYLFYLMRSMIHAAVEKGMSEDQAKPLVVQSMIGGGLLSRCSTATMTELLGDVCVPGGSTEKAMATLDDYKVNESIMRAVDSSWRANVKMGTCMSNEN